MPMEVKICGLTEPAGVAAALNARADLVGFVFFPPSPRNISVGQAKQLAGPARGRAQVVALTVDADDKLLDEIVAGLAPDLLQLHGSESPDRAGQLGRRYGLPVMKALGVRAAGDVVRARDFLDAAQRILFDAKPPAGATRPGGLGRSFDWRLLADLDLPVPYMLSGGLDPASVGEAIRIARPQAVDVSSGVEASHGIKDPEKVRHFIDAVRAAESGSTSVEKEGIV